MGDQSAIEWTDSTWNPIRGCSRVSEGCRNCYAERQAIRIKANQNTIVRSTADGPRWTGIVGLVEKNLELPLRWKKPRRIFVNSMSDLFHEKVPDEWIDRIFAVMATAPQHTFQVLTKRPGRMLEWSNRTGTMFSPAWPLPNVWLGVSVEDQATADERIPLLLQTPAAVRWVSYEPALGPIWFHRYTYDFGNVGFGGTIRRLGWIVVGGESGPGARPFDLAWARQTIAQGRAAGVPVFVKQLGGVPWRYNGDYNPYLKLRDRKGGDPQEWPSDLRVREYPRVG